MIKKEEEEGLMHASLLPLDCVCSSIFENAVLSLEAKDNASGYRETAQIPRRESSFARRDRRSLDGCLVKPESLLAGR